MDEESADEGGQESRGADAPTGGAAAGYPGIADELELYTEMLQELSWRLRRYATLAALLLVLSLVLSVAVIATLAVVGVDLSGGILWLVAVVVAVELFVLALFDRTRREGRALSEQVNDNFQESMRTRHAPGVRERRNRARFTVRQFQAAGDLPLAPGELGPAIYALVVIFVGIGTVVWWSSRIG